MDLPKKLLKKPEIAGVLGKKLILSESYRVF